MLLHFQPKIHPYWPVVQVSIYFPWDPERYHSHWPSAVDPVSVPQSQAHLVTKVSYHSSSIPVLQPLFSILEYFSLSSKSTGYFLSTVPPHFFLIFRLPCQTWFQSYISYFFSWPLTCSSAMRISLLPEGSVASSTLQLMEKGQMEDVSMRISLIFCI